MKLNSICIASVLLGTTGLTSTAFAGSLTRVSTIPLEAEITGMYLEGSDFFFNVQHPDAKLENAFSKATVGVISNANWTADALSVPTEDADKKIVRSALGEYQILLQEGDFGIVGSIKSINGEELLVSNKPDFNGFVNTGENEGYLFTNWEDRPGGMSRAKLSRNASGAWSVDQNDIQMIDFSQVAGTWVNCFGTMSPWNTPLSSEELYFDNTANWNNPDFSKISDNKTLAKYLGGHYPNPYNYGYIVEITNPAETPTPVKMKAMGRFSHENAVVMPDLKTVYLSDDGTGVVFFKFIADKEGDLSAGTLYAAKIMQNGDAGADAATTTLGIEWVELAHSSNEEIALWVKDYDDITLDDYKTGETSYISDKEIAEWAEGKAADNRVVFLESRKAAVAKGATGEFRKMEGVNINFKAAKDGSAPYMYMAMSEISKTMSDGKGDIHLAENKCGVVYEMKLDENFNTTEMVPVVAGDGYNKDNAPNACSVDSISNPDNVVVLADGGVVIGEDTGNHENNAMWIWRR